MCKCHIRDMRAWEDNGWAEDLLGRGYAAFRWILEGFAVVMKQEGWPVVAHCFAPLTGIAPQLGGRALWNRRRC